MCVRENERERARESDGTYAFVPHMCCNTNVLHACERVLHACGRVGIYVPVCVRERLFVCILDTFYFGILWNAFVCILENMCVFWKTCVYFGKYVCILDTFYFGILWNACADLLHEGGVVDV